MRVLSDNLIKSLLNNLTRDELLQYQKSLANALIEFNKDPSIIPQRIVTQPPATGSTHLFMASTGSSVGMKALTGSKEGFKGVTSILNPISGELIGLLNASTLTAFRTALATSLSLIKTFPTVNDFGSSSPYSSSSTSNELVCFGTGLQAYWHIKTTLILYPNLITKIHVVNRSLDKAKKFVDELKQELNESDKNIEFNYLELSNFNEITNAIKNASIIYSCIPTTSPTISKLNLSNSLKSKVFIGAIGSYKPHMIEISGDILIDLIIENGGKIIVDSKEHCLEEAGELIINKIGADSLIEISELYMEDSASAGVSQLNWMQSPTTKFVVTKLVGLCIMDVAVGKSILETANSRNLGVEIEF